MIKLIIFDLDGTLLDTLEDLATSVNYALTKNNFLSHSIESYKYFIGNGVNNLINKALPVDVQNKDMVAKVKTDFLENYFKNADNLTKPYPGIIHLLKSLEAKGYKMAVASNKMHEATVNLVNKFFAEINFISILGQRDGFPTKPNPSILEEIIHKAGFDKSEVLYVGDSGVDVACAYNARIEFIGVLWGFRPRKELEEVGASVFASTSEELMSLIKRLK